MITNVLGFFSCTFCLVSSLVKVENYQVNLKHETCDIVYLTGCRCPLFHKLNFIQINLKRQNITFPDYHLEILYNGVYKFFY